MPCPSLKAVRAILKKKFGINHVTVQIEDSRSPLEEAALRV